MEYKIDGTYKGTRILLGETARRKREIINSLALMCEEFGFEEVFLPSIELADIYVDKAGKEVLNQMFGWLDKSDRPICLRPEGTATCQLLATSLFKFQKDVKLFYTANCWRYEQPQAGRYREFTQFGVEWLNPSNVDEAKEALVELAEMGIQMLTDKYEINHSATRGLAYYVDAGFEVSCPELGAQKQVLGGGTYKEGVGFAFGVDRLLLLK